MKYWINIAKYKVLDIISGRKIRTNEKSILLKKINELNELYSNRKNPERGSSENILEKIDFLLKNYLESNPQDTEIWLKLTMHEVVNRMYNWEMLYK